MELIKIYNRGIDNLIMSQIPFITIVTPAMAEQTPINDTFVGAQRKDEEEAVVPHKKIAFYKLNSFKAVCVVILVSAVVIPLLYFFLVDNADETREATNTCMLHPSYRVQCGKVNGSYDNCVDVNCCYDDDTSECYHTYPADYYYSKFGNGDLFKPSHSVSPLETDMVAELKLCVHEELDKIQIAVHGAEQTCKARKIDSAPYVVNTYKTLAVEVLRNNDANKRILTTGSGPLIASAGYWEWTIQLTTEELFGLGQLILNSSEPITKVIYKNRNDHTTTPTFIARQNGSYHGLIVEHDGPLEVMVLPSKLIVLRSLLGKQFTLNLVLGPTPRDVMGQMRARAVVPKWVMGPHLCRPDASKYTANPYLSYVSDCLHEDLMLNLMVETDAGKINDMKDKVTEVKRTKKFVLYVTPHVPIDSSLYSEGEQLKIFYLNETGGAAHKGKYLKRDVAFIDFTSANIMQWIDKLIDKIKLIDPALGDAIVLMDNWPEDDKYESLFCKFPYMTDKMYNAMLHSIPCGALPSNGNLHYETHNDYAKQQYDVVKSSFPNTVIMSSSYVHQMDTPVIVRNMNLTWGDFKEAMSKSLSHSFFSGTLVSTPVCGSESFKSKQDEVICIRWFLMASTMSMFSTRHDWPTQTGFGYQVAEEALLRREQLSHYYYKFVYDGEPLARPMFYDFPDDANATILDEQYMVGDSMLVAHPVLATNLLKVYFPPEVDWYEFSGGSYLEELGWSTVNIVDSDFIAYIRGGSIIPVKTNNDLFNLIVALACNESCEASGELLFNEERLLLEVAENLLHIKNILKVKNEICIKADDEKMLQTGKIYGKAGVTSLNINIDLCAGNSDEVNININ